MASDKEITDCPFCGGPCEAFFVTGMAFDYWCGCRVCKIYVAFRCQTDLGSGDQTARRKAIAAWNRRIDPAPVDLPLLDMADRLIERLHTLQYDDLYELSEILTQRIADEPLVHRARVIEKIRDAVNLVGRGAPYGTAKT